MIGEKAGNYSLETELENFQTTFNSKLADLLVGSLNSWIVHIREATKVNPELRDIILINLQLLTNSKALEQKLMTWKDRFNEMLMDLLNVKGIIRSVESGAEIEELCKEIKGHVTPMSYLSVLKKYYIFNPQKQASKDGFLWR